MLRNLTMKRRYFSRIIIIQTATAVCFSRCKGRCLTTLLILYFYHLTWFLSHMTFHCDIEDHKTRDKCGLIIYAHRAEKNRYIVCPWWVLCLSMTADSGSMDFLYIMLPTITKSTVLIRYGLLFPSRQSHAQTLPGGSDDNNSDDVRFSSLCSKIATLIPNLDVSFKCLHMEHRFETLEHLLSASAKNGNRLPQRAELCTVNISTQAHVR